MSDNEGSVPTEGIDYGDTMVVWPSTGRIPGGDVKPGGSSGLAPSMPPGWGDYSPQGIALVQSVLFLELFAGLFLIKNLKRETGRDGLSVCIAPGETRKFPLHEQFLKMVYVVVCQNRLARLLFLLPVWSLLPEMSKKLFVLWLHSNWSR
ncbi:putative colicin activity protein [Escherichia coli]|nr:putative colicin activity protein [Escherichia coli]